MDEWSIRSAKAAAEIARMAQVTPAIFAQSAPDGVVHSKAPGVAAHSATTAKVNAKVVREWEETIGSRTP
jgi:hypothetical protein